MATREAIVRGKVNEDTAWALRALQRYGQPITLPIAPTCCINCSAVWCSIFLPSPSYAS
jgi:hypothetical protein